MIKVRMSLFRRNAGDIVSMYVHIRDFESLEAARLHIRKKGLGSRSENPLAELMKCISRLIRNRYLERNPESPNFKLVVMPPTLQNCILSNAYAFAKPSEICVVTQWINDKEVLNFVPSATYRKKLTKKDITTWVWLLNSPRSGLLTKNFIQGIFVFSVLSWLSALACHCHRQGRSSRVWGACPPLDKT